MGQADNQLIATRHSCKVKFGCYTMTICCCRTKPPLMMPFKSARKRKEACISSACTAATDVSEQSEIRSFRSGFRKILNTYVLSYTTNPKNQHFATTTLKHGLAKCSITILYVCHHPSGPRNPAPAQQDRATKSRNQQLRHVMDIREQSLRA